MADAPMNLLWILLLYLQNYDIRALGIDSNPNTVASFETCVTSASILSIGSGVHCGDSTTSVGGR